MTFTQEILGTLGVLALGGIWYWISSVNARFQSHAERVWGTFALFLFAIAIIGFWMAVQNIPVSTDEALVHSVLGLMSLGASYLVYQAWQAGLDEESS